jgi:hypothetical protein
VVFGQRQQQQQQQQQQGVKASRAAAAPAPVGRSGVRCSMLKVRWLPSYSIATWSCVHMALPEAMGVV